MNYQDLMFFKDLSANNNSEWFAERKKTYERNLKLPFEKLIESVISEIVKIEGKEFPATAKSTMFRINRDVRFSKNKEPYKTHLSSLISYYGKKSNFPGLYIQLSWDKIWIGGGCYVLDKNELFKVRDSIDYHLEEFNEIIANPVFLKNFGAVMGDKNKVIPSEFKPTFEKQPLIANKQFYVIKELVTNEANVDNLFKLTVDTYKAMKPFNDFLTKALLVED